MNSTAAIRIIDEADRQGKCRWPTLCVRYSMRTSARNTRRAPNRVSPRANQVDPATDLVDDIEATRTLKDIVFNPDTRTLIEGIIEAVE